MQEFICGIAVLVFLLAVSFWVGYVVGRHTRPARKFKIRQKGHIMITGVVVGASGDFTATPNGALQAGNVPTWASDDTTVTVSAAVDGLSATASVPAGHAPSSFNLTVSGVNSAGAAISSSVAVPILPPAVQPATSFTIDQTA